MKRILLLPAALLLAGCATAPLRDPHTGAPDSSIPSDPAVAAPATQMPGDPLATPVEKGFATAGPSATPSSPDRLEFRIAAAKARSFAPALFLSPEGSRLAYTYESGRPADAPLIDIAVVPLSPVPGQGRVMAWAQEPAREAKIGPGLRLAGWLDEHRLVLLRALPTGDEPWASSAMRVEVLDTVDEKVTVGPWIAMGRGRWNLQQFQVWLTADRQELIVNTGDLWRIELPSGQPVRIKASLPSLGDAGPLTMTDRDGHLALYGGGPDRVARGLIDLRSGREYVLRSEWQVAAFGSDRRLAVLANQAGHPGEEVTDGSGTRSLYSAALILKPDGSQERVVESPLGWLLEEAAFTPDGNALLLTGVQVTPDPTNLQTRNRLSRRALFVAPVDGRSPILLWEGAKERMALPAWTLSGSWLLIDGRQVALADGQSLPLPKGMKGLPLVGKPDGLIGWQQDGTLVRFAAGSAEAAAIGKSSIATGGAGLRAQMAGPWLLLQSDEGDGTVRVEVLRLR